MVVSQKLFVAFSELSLSLRFLLQGLRWQEARWRGLKNGHEILWVIEGYLLMDNSSSFTSWDVFNFTVVKTFRETKMNDLIMIFSIDFDFLWIRLPPPPKKIKAPLKFNVFCGACDAAGGGRRFTEGTVHEKVKEWTRNSEGGRKPVEPLYKPPMLW